MTGPHELAEPAIMYLGLTDSLADLGAAVLIVIPVSASLCDDDCAPEPHPHR